MDKNISDFYKGKDVLVSKKSVKSLSEFFQYVDVARKLVFKNEKIWYRGHADVRYKLIPNIYRQDYSYLKENKIRKEFKDKFKGFVNSNQYDEFEIYFLMQHYGVPTRLLDWSEGYLIALFFALKLSIYESKLYDSCVWLINPEKLNSLTHSKNQIIRIDQTDDNEFKALALQYFNFKNEDMDKLPMAISSTYSNERILRQKGCFTIHGTDLLTIDSLYKKNHCNEIVKIIIDRKSVSKIRKELDLAGISETSLFPDLDGLAREIKYNYYE